MYHGISMHTQINVMKTKNTKPVEVWLVSTASMLAQNYLCKPKGLFKIPYLLPNPISSRYSSKIVTTSFTRDSSNLLTSLKCLTKQTSTHRKPGNFRKPKYQVSRVIQFWDMF